MRRRQKGPHGSAHGQGRERAPVALALIALTAAGLTNGVSRVSRNLAESQATRLGSVASPHPFRCRRVSVSADFAKPVQNRRGPNGGVARWGHGGAFPTEASRVERRWRRHRNGKTNAFRSCRGVYEAASRACIPGVGFEQMLGNPGLNGRANDQNGASAEATLKRRVPAP
jgi:hypothetical protein